MTYRLAATLSLAACTLAGVAPDSPLLFEANQGQADPTVRYLARSRAATGFLLDDRAVFSFAGSHLALRFTGTSRAGVWRTGDAAAQVFSFTGRREQWRSGVEAFRSVTHAGLYPGIDAVFYGAGHEFEVDYVVHPGADAGQLRFHLEGGERTELTASGDLVTVTPMGPFRQRRPVAYQDGPAGREPVAAEYLFSAGTRDIAIRVGAYDRRRPLIIDPVLETSALFGGAGDDSFVSAGDLKAGNTNSINFPGSTADPAGLLDCFLNVPAQGGGLASIIYFGGSGNDVIRSMTGSPVGPLVVVGETDSRDFPAGLLRGGLLRGNLPPARTFQMQYGGGDRDGFVLTLMPGAQGAVYSSYWGGPEADRLHSVAQIGNQLVAVGTTSSPGLASAAARQPGLAGASDAFVLTASLDLRSSAGTYWGGAADDDALAITSDPAAGFIVAGETSSSDFPVAEAFQPASGGGRDGFVLRGRLAGGNALEFGFASYVGTSADDRLQALAWARDGRSVLAAGSSNGQGWWNRLRLDPPALVSQARVGGSRFTEITGIGETGAGDVIVAGTTSSPDLPVRDAVQAEFGGGATDGFVSYIRNDGTTAYLTYLGGSGPDRILALEVTPDGIARVAGDTASADFPQTGAAARVALQGGMDAFSAELTSGLLQAENLVVGRNLERPLQIAVSGDGAVTGRSSDPTRVLLAAQPGQAGGATATASRGQRYPVMTVQGLSQQGEATVMVATPGLPDRAATVKLVPAGALVGPRAPAEALTRRVSIPPGFDYLIAIHAAALDAGTKQVLERQSPRRGVALDVRVISSNPEVGTVERLSQGELIFRPAAQGVTQLTIQSQPDGFETPALEDFTVEVRLRDFAPFTCPPIGKDQQVRLSLLAFGPLGTGPVTLASADRSRLLVSANPAQAGQATLDVTAARPDFYVQALAAEGDSQFTLSAAGYSPAVVTCPFARSSFAVTQRPLQVRTGVTDNAAGEAFPTMQLPNGQFAGPHQLRGGLTVAVPFAIADPAVVRSPANEVVIFGGQLGQTFSLEGLKDGETTLALGTPPGFAEPGALGTLAVRVRANAARYAWTVAPPVLGQDLAIPAFVRVESSPRLPLPMTFRSADPQRLLVSASASSPGSAEVTIPYSTASGGAQVYLQALAGDGVVEVTVQAGDGEPVTHAVRLLPASLVFATTGPVEVYTVQRAASLRPAIRVGTGLADVPGLANMLVRPGKSVRVRLVSSSGEIVAALDPVTLPSPNASVALSYRPRTAGEVTLQLVSDDFPAAQRGGQIRVNVRAPGLALPRTMTLGQDGQTQATAGLVSGTAVPANWDLPASIDVVLTSSDPGLVRVSAQRTLGGAASATVALRPGSPFPPFFVEALASAGRATITASAPGFSAATMEVLLSPSGLVFVTTEPGAALRMSLSETRAYAVRAALLDAGGRPVAPLTLRPGRTVNAALGSDDSRVATVDAALTLTANQSERNVTLRAVGPGRTRIFLATPADFSTAEESFRVLEVMVTAPALQFDSPVVGQDLQAGVSTRSPVPIPPGGVPFTVVSDDPGLVLVSATAREAGAASAQGVLRTTAGPLFYLHGLASIGSARVRLRPEGWGESTILVELAGPSIQISSAQLANNRVVLSGTPSVFTLTTGIEIARGYFPLPVRFGQQLTVRMQADRPGIAALRGVPVIFAGGEGSKTFEATGADVGETLIHVLPPTGFSTSTVRSSILVTYNAARLVLEGFNAAGGFRLGKNFQLSLTVSRSDRQPLAATVTSLEPLRVLVSTGRTQPGQARATLPASTSAQFWIQGMVDSGTSLVEVSAPGLPSRQFEVQVEPAGFGLFVFAVNDTVVRTNAASAVTFGVAPMLTDGERQFLRPGAAAVPLVITSQNERVGTPDLAVFPAGEGSLPVVFRPAGAGATVLTLQPPEGYVRTARLTLPVEVTAPELTPNPTPPSAMGKDTQVGITFTLPPNRLVGTVVRATSLDPSLMVLSTQPGVLGTASFDISVPTNVTSFTIYLQALSNSGTAQLVVTSEAYNPARAEIRLEPSGWRFRQGAVTLGRNTTDTVTAELIRLESGGTAELRAGVAGPTAVSSDASIVSVTGATRGTISVRTGAGAGNAVLTLQQPPGFMAPPLQTQMQIRVQ